MLKNVLAINGEVTFFHRSNRMKTCILIFSVILFLPAYAQHSSSHQNRLKGFEYLEHANTPGNDQPLLIAFHYSSGTPKETLADYDSIKGSIRIIIPKGNYRKRDGFSYYPVDYYKTDSATQFAASRITVDSIAIFVQAIEKKYQRKAIVSGISQGGDIALLLAIYYPDLCVASFPFAAVINPSVVEMAISKKSKSIPIHLHQGEADAIVSVNYTRRKVTALSKKLNITLYTYPGVGHDISAEMKASYSKQIDDLSEK